MAFIMLGLVAGPLLGGIITQYSSWRWCKFPFTSHYECTVCTKKFRLTMSRLLHQPPNRSTQRSDRPLHALPVSKTHVYYVNTPFILGDLQKTRPYRFCNIRTILHHAPSCPPMGRYNLCMEIRDNHRSFPWVVGDILRFRNMGISYWR